VSQWYYLAESVLLASHRGQGIGHRFFEEREAAGTELGFRRFAFCSVIREESDSRRPPGHRELAPFWKARGYCPSEVHAVLEWKEVGAAGSISHCLQFWFKDQQH
jgi:hypothetical protein